VDPGGPKGGLFQTNGTTTEKAWFCLIDIWAEGTKRQALLSRAEGAKAIEHLNTACQLLKFSSGSG